MSTIKIDNLSVTGSELFDDSESYLDQLSESDALSIQGGLNSTIITVTTVTATTTTAIPTTETTAILTIKTITLATLGLD
ncbi:hypothetical protein [Nostoc punctiforme]|uniref:hypothetical protein n=1 Tax=Nostoc punctiforme TaxID=272131 RepID=UPI000045C196|nr:hypothetical protein [Nostoc punctiforme]